MNSFKRPRGNVVTRPSLGVDLKTDAGRSEEFRQGSRECLHCAKSLHKQSPHLRGEYILAFHAIELALKAFLAKRGLSNAALARSPYSHNLVKLCAEARAQGLRLTVHNADALIEWINEYHDEGAAIRYKFAEQTEIPNCTTLFPIAEEILTASKYNAPPLQSALVR